MRVLIIVPDKLSYGGAFRFLQRLLDIHRHRNIQSALLVADEHLDEYIKNLSSQYKLQFYTPANSYKSNVIPALTPYYDFRFSWNTYKLWNPDLIIVSTAEPGRMTAAMFFPVPVVYFLHSMPEKHFCSIAKIYMCIGASLNNIVATVSKTAAYSLSNMMGVPKSRVKVVYNSCYSADMNVSKENEPVVLTLGHLVSYKNPDVWLMTAVRVIEKMPTVKFTWLGAGKLLHQFRDRVKSLGLEGSIKFPGFVHNPVEWYQKAQVYFQPSLRESHGIAVLEAMSHALPCVVSDIGGLPESVLMGETGYVCKPDDIDGFANSILTLLKNSEMCRCMGIAGQKRLVVEFSPEVQEKKIMDIYCKLSNKMENL